MMRSCSSCSRTGRTRIGLTHPPTPCTDIGHREVIRRPKGLNIARDRLTTSKPGPHNGPVPPPQVNESAPRVLIVDDDVSVTDTFSRMLRLEGYEVWAALSAYEGLSLAQTH